MVSCGGKVLPTMYLQLPPVVFVRPRLSLSLRARTPESGKCAHPVMSVQDSEILLVASPKGTV